jgi:hypothetical protein
MPAIAAMDNETLDHLLSVVDDAGNLASLHALSKPGCGGEEEGTCTNTNRDPTDLA